MTIMTFKVKTITLTPQEQDILDGKQGKVLQKILGTIVCYGEALGARRLVDISGNGHFVITHAIPGISPSMEMLDELLAAGLKTRYPFTLDPKAPLDVANWHMTEAQIALVQEMYVNQDRYDGKMLQLGLRDLDACTCTPYLPEVGNIPKRGEILAWSESACAIFANSVLGARTNKNGAIIDLLSNIVGKVPHAGLLTDEGRRATWLVEVNTESLPLPQLLGAAVGTKVVSGVPYIKGLDKFLGPELTDTVRDYLHEMGTACATAGAVGLFHAENITPEAIDQGTALLLPDHGHYIIDDPELDVLLDSYPVMWDDPDKLPDKCFIGCPHLSLQQLGWWAEKIDDALKEVGKKEVAVKTTLCAAPQVLEAFRNKNSGYQKLHRAGVKFSEGCPMQVFDNDLSVNDAIITNSNKLRAYTAARFFPDEALLGVLVNGACGERRSK
jgi:predicted aconitase